MLKTNKDLKIWKKQKNHTYIKSKSNIAKTEATAWLNSEWQKFMEDDKNE